MSRLILGATSQLLHKSSPFLGEVAAADFITGDALASMVGLTAGISHHSDEPWLKFKDPVDGKIKYVSRKPLRNSLSWAQLNSAGVVTGSKTVQINGQTYKVRLLKGASKPASAALDYMFDAPDTHGSEWNRLLYNISGKPFTHTANSLSSEGVEEGQWAQYSEEELLTNYKYGQGSYCWCQETNSSNALYRGGDGARFLNWLNSPGIQHREQA